MSDVHATEPGTDERPRTSTRDHEVVRSQLEQWLATKLDDARVTDFAVPAGNGMSSETILFDATWSEGGTTRSDRFVLRLPPDPSAEPVFPVYDMPKQFKAMRLVAERTGIAIPPTLWLEPDPSHLGAPFFVMGRVDGVVPPDLMPYTFGGNWLFDADAEERAILQRTSVEVLAKIHSIAADDADTAFLAYEVEGDSALRRHVNDQRAFYEWVAADGVRSPLIEQAFEWLEANWPALEGEAVVSWGDSRIGNIMYREFQPVAVLDWEMAGHAPREVDVAWLVFMHRFFQDLTEQFGFDGIPDFMRLADVEATYTELTGHTLRDMQWYLVYANVRYSVVMFRITRRQILFGEATMPENPDHAFINHPGLTAMLDGSYWSKL